MFSQHFCKIAIDKKFVGWKCCMLVGAIWYSGAEGAKSFCITIECLYFNIGLECISIQKAGIL